MHGQCAKAAFRVLILLLWNNKASSFPLGIASIKGQRDSMITRFNHSPICIHCQIHMLSHLALSLRHVAIQQWRNGEGWAHSYLPYHPSTKCVASRSGSESNDKLADAWRSHCQLQRRPALPQQLGGRGEGRERCGWRPGQKAWVCEPWTGRLVDLSVQACAHTDVHRTTSDVPWWAD